ncbi:MAG: hypothetical protein JJU11_07795 [Candidatus Sumerlaeia bacterium]|nr:hypothetical protein [Candidatus Sumerlaeia bacterium]
MTSSWRPTEILSHLRSHNSSTGPILVETDAGDAWIKAIGNPEGEHALVCEWVGTSLARLLGLRTLHFQLLHVDDIIPLPLGRGGGLARPGAAFATRAEKGHPWGGTAEGLHHVRNRADLSAIIVFDTFVRNRDRWAENRQPNYDNVFLSSEETKGEALDLVVMDHTHCLVEGGEITAPALRRAVDDVGVYGAFPALRPYWDESATVAFQQRLAKLERQDVSRIVTCVPRDWELESTLHYPLVDFIMTRAARTANRPATDFQPKEE